MLSMPSTDVFIPGQYIAQSRNICFRAITNGVTNECYYPSCIQTLCVAFQFFEYLFDIFTLPPNFITYTPGDDRRMLTMILYHVCNLFNMGHMYCVIITTFSRLLPPWNFLLYQEAHFVHLRQNVITLRPVKTG